MHEEGNTLSFTEFETFLTVLKYAIKELKEIYF